MELNRPQQSRLELDHLESVLEAMARVHLLVVGDVVLDEYLWGEVDRVSPEAPVPVVRVSRESIVLGGAGNVVRNVVALGGSCSFLSVVGADTDGERVRSALASLGVDADGVVDVPGRQTTRKTRVVARSQQVARFDRETPHAVPDTASARILELAGAQARRAQGAVIEDYGKGLLVPDLARSLVAGLSAAGVFVAVDPKRELDAFAGASLLKPNLREAEALTGVRVHGPEDLDRVAKRLFERVGPCELAITRGGAGMAVFDGDVPGVSIPTVARSVFDVQGAGDTTIAALALARCAGASLVEAAVLANAAAGIVVGKIGTATASADEVRAVLPSVVGAAEAAR